MSPFRHSALSYLPFLACPGVDSPQHNPNPAAFAMVTALFTLLARLALTIPTHGPVELLG